MNKTGKFRLFTRNPAKKLNSSTGAAVKRVASGFYYVHDLLHEVNQISQRNDLKTREAAAREAMALLKWIGRAEKRIDKEEGKILTNLKAINPHLPVSLKSKDKELSQKLEIAEKELIELISQYQGKLKKELTEIAEYLQLEEHMHHTQEVDEKLNLLVEKTKKDIQRLEQWMQGTEVILQSIKNFSGTISALKKPGLQQGALSRRSFLKGAAATGAVLASGIPGKALASIGDVENKLRAINYACEKMEQYLHKMSKGLSHPLIFTPHADYTHFNRVGKWTHDAILKEAEKVVEDWGSRDASLFAIQRAKATEAMQPTDQEVSITERSLVTLANMVGRSRIPGKVFVAKHFPGGPPELELTEAKEVTLKGTLKTFKYLKPFQDLTKLPETKAIMVCHVSYPELESDLEASEQRSEKLIRQELAEFGMTKEKYDQWILTRPATMSPTLIRSLLTQRLGFEGIIIPDAMNMASFTWAGERFIKYLDKEKINRFMKMKRYLEEPTLANILLIYAGINFFLLHPVGDIRYIQEYAKAKPYFAKCVDEAFVQYQKLHTLTGKRPPKAKDVAEKVLHVIRSSIYPFESRQDAWDRSGVIHRIFRSHYLSKLHQDKNIIKHRKKFWKIHQETDWNKLDSLFQEVIETRYHKIKLAMTTK